MQPAGSQADPPVTERYPFWNYEDLALFVGAFLPSMLVAWLLAQVLPVSPDQRAVRVLLPQFLGYGFWFASLYLILKLRYDRPFWRSLAWTLPARAGWLSLFAGPFLALAVGIAGTYLRTPEVPMPIKDLLTNRSSIVLVGLFATALGPLCEEMAFRGFLQPLVTRSIGVTLGILTTGVAFALLHGPQYAWSWRHLVLLLAAGCAFGWTRYRTGSTAAATLVHGSYNLTFFVGYLMQGKNLPSSW